MQQSNQSISQKLGKFQEYGIVTGDVFPFHIGPILADRPHLAFQKGVATIEPYRCTGYQEIKEAVNAALHAKKNLLSTNKHSRKQV